MKITVEFDNLEEIQDFCNGVYIAPGLAGEARKETAEAEAVQVPEQKAEKKPAKAKKEEAPAEPVEEPKEAEEPVQEAEKPAEASSEIKGDDLKKVLAGKLKAGKKAEVKELFSKYGVESLSELLAKKDLDMPAVMKEAEAI